MNHLIIFVSTVVSVPIVFWISYLVTMYYSKVSFNKDKFIRKEAQKRIELEENNCSGRYTITTDKYVKFGSIQAFKRQLNQELCYRGYPELTESYNYKASDIMEGKINGN